MCQGYFWPIYGEADEVVFPFAPCLAASSSRDVRSPGCWKAVTTYDCAD